MKQPDDSDVSPWEELQDMLTAYLDEEARIAHQRTLLDKARQQLSREFRANRRLGGEIAEYWWREIGEPLGNQPGRTYEIPLKADPWIGSVCMIFEYDPASAMMRAHLRKSFGPNGRPLKPVRDPEIEWPEEG